MFALISDTKPVPWSLATTRGAPRCSRMRSTIKFSASNAGSSGRVAVSTYLVKQSIMTMTQRFTEGEWEKGSRRWTPIRSKDLEVVRRVAEVLIQGVRLRHWGKTHEERYEEMEKHMLFQEKQRQAYLLYVPRCPAVRSLLQGCMIWLRRCRGAARRRKLFNLGHEIPTYDTY